MPPGETLQRCPHPGFPATCLNRRVYTAQGGNCKESRNKRQFPTGNMRNRIRTRTSSSKRYATNLKTHEPVYISTSSPESMCKKIRKPASAPFQVFLKPLQGSSSTSPLRRPLWRYQSCEFSGSFTIASETRGRLAWRRLPARLWCPFPLSPHPLPLHSPS